MKTKYKIIIGIVVILIPIYIIGMNYQPKGITYKIIGDFSDSGTQRNYLVTIIFSDYDIVTAREKYTVFKGDGCKENCKYEYECSNGITDGWKSYDMNGFNVVCSNIENYVPLSRKGIEQKIKSGEYKPIGSCNKGDLCYEIPPENDPWAGWN
ncbi:MAG: hypothetical protein WC241_00245 [Candidatus Paceibacterota bacterium]|jgi:hypothetical protein